ncbi:MAG: ABC transporter permease [Acidobacteriia bacterium]|nr:ABC transporter permease [Terriglobia bacterium]
METLLHDLRYGVRMLRKSPSFTAIAVLTLALGIGSTVAIFSVVDQVLLHSLPYPDADRIMYVSQTERGGNELHYASSPANYLDWVAQNHVFSVMAASRGWQGNLGGDRPERVRLSMTTASLFPLFAVHPMLGRGLESEDEEPSNDHVAVLSYGLWNRRFGADPGLINQSITLNNETYTVVGVMPSNFLPDGYGELWVPSPWGVPSHPLVPSQDPRQFRDRNYLDVWGRLKPGVTQHQAEQEMSAIARRLEKQYPDSNDGIGVGMMSLQDSVVSDIRPVLYVLLAAVAFVLLIGCTNVANLLLARSSGRTREISIRIALGAGRRRIVSQLLTESVLLAVAGGLLGIVIAAWAVPTLVALGPSEIRDYGNIGVNLEALAFAVVVSILTGVLFGLAPALHASEGKVSDSLKEGERGSTAQRGRTRTALVVAEVALSLILLIGAGLTVRSFVRVLRVDPGFDASHLLVFGVGLPPSASADEQDRFYRQVAEKLETLPGVQSAGAVSRLPLSGGNSGRSFKLPGSAKDYSADIRVETPRYLQTMGVSLLKGRYLDEHDIAGATPVIVVNEAFTKSVFPGEDPIGKYITDFGPGMDKLQIVGVVGNVRHVALEAAPRAEVYLPFGQAHWTSAFVAVRTKTSDPLALVPAVQNAVWSVDKTVPLAGVRTMQDLIARSLVQRKFTMTLLAIFAALAVVLAAIGLYGAMSYSVSQRTREIGIRMALGAQKKDVLKMVVGQGMGLAAIGVAVGIAGSLGMMRLISGLLFGVSATDPVTFILLAMVLAGVAFAANYIPARRATAVDPMVALRYE